MADNMKSFKPIFFAALRKIDSDVIQSYKNPFSVDPYDYPKPIEGIHDALMIHAKKHHIKVDSGRLAKVAKPFDYYMPKYNCIIELDERQHFTAARALSLKLYPKTTKLGFNPSEWVELCCCIQATDRDPLWRNEQRAWLDTLRDLAWQVPEFSELTEIKSIARIFERNVLSFYDNPKGLVTYIKRYLNDFEVGKS